MRLFRLFKIFYITFKFGLEEFIFAHSRFSLIRKGFQKVLFFRNTHQARGVRLRLALEALGPIFVKFGQILSTRRDLIPLDIADELAKLQDQVPPFDYAIAEKLSHKPTASPSIKCSASLTKRLWQALLWPKCILLT